LLQKYNIGASFLHQAFASRVSITVQAMINREQKSLLLASPLVGMPPFGKPFMAKILNFADVGNYSRQCGFFTGLLASAEKNENDAR